jgi:hypothetical protein
MAVVVEVDTAVEARIAGEKGRSAVAVQTTGVEAHIGNIGMTTVHEEDRAGFDGKEKTAKVATVA